MSTNRTLTDNAPTRGAHRRRLPLVMLAALLLPVAACGSDSDDPVIETPDTEELVPLDPTVDDGIDTNVEQPGNLNFDTEQPDLVDE